MTDAKNNFVADTPAPYQGPRFWRLAIGFLLAPLVPAVVWGLFVSGQRFPQTDIDFIGIAAVYFGYPATLVLGVPAYLLLRRRVRPTLPTVVLVGGLVAATPWLVLMLLNENAAQATWRGFLEHLKFLFFVFGLGAVGGLTFWIAVVCKEPRLAGKEPPSETSEA